VTGPRRGGCDETAIFPHLTVWAHDGDLVVWYAACGICAACSAGRPAACVAPLPALEPRTAQETLPERCRRRPGAASAAVDPALLLAAAVADEVVRDGVAAPAVIVVGDGPLAAATALSAAGAGATEVALLGDPGMALPAPLFAATDDDAVRAWLKPRAASGRADLVLAADGDLVRAARLVRRGGAIAATATTADGDGGRPTRPSITTLVQRELELLTPRDLVRGALACALPVLIATAGSPSDRGGRNGR
jgi:threonine dehydrogenase-like Zn-dependent dehydrogenase